MHANNFRPLLPLPSPNEVWGGVGGNGLDFLSICVKLHKLSILFSRIAGGHLKSRAVHYLFFILQ